MNEVRATEAGARQDCLECPVMPYAASYIAALVFFLAVDIAWITTVMRPIFCESRRQIGQRNRSDGLTVAE